MKILVCSDGTGDANNAIHLTGILTGQGQTAITLLGVAEQPRDDQPLRAALDKQAESLRAFGAPVEIMVRDGDPIRQMVDVTSSNQYDLAVIGARGTGPSGLHQRSRRTYDIVKAIEPPVLVAMGESERVKRILVCTGGKRFIDDALNLTAEIAAGVGASVTLLHVMAEPPAIYADLIALEKDVDRLIESGSELGLNLKAQKETLERRGVRTEIQIRHGLVPDQIFKEAREGNHDLIVTGSSQAEGPFRHYIMGDVTHSILNRANCPVLVARAKKTAGP